VLEARVRDHRVEPTESLDRGRDRIAVALARREVGREVHVAANVDGEEVPAVAL
jgi:hypothetical protein